MKRTRTAVGAVRGRDWRTGFPITRGIPLTRIGTRYGGWVVPDGVLNKHSICYCGGVGEDVSFDIGLIEKYNCAVYAFDPTPRAVNYVQENYSDYKGFHFSQIGLWDSDSVLKFFAPANSEHVSHSIMNLHKSDEFFEARCLRLSQIMNENGHKQIDLLKLDIEGAEYKVIESLLYDRLNIKIICIEYDEAHTPIDDGFLTRIRESISSLIDSGYRLIAVDGCNYTFALSTKHSGH
ncbi:MAG: FkbM family methyltransferase [Gammaproteobacteria bacterium]|nr:FkbM family methyltransferase [Gammaproteobacteria bacterium]MDH3767170.1 FkbM family methyltransferase [Gammaproteobacteria bacterium]